MRITGSDFWALEIFILLLVLPVTSEDGTILFPHYRWTTQTQRVKVTCPSPINAKYWRFEVTHSRMSTAQRKPWDAAHITAQLKKKKKKSSSAHVVSSCVIQTVVKGSHVTAMHSSVTPIAQPLPRLLSPITTLSCTLVCLHHTSLCVSNTVS